VPKPQGLARNRSNSHKSVSSEAPLGLGPEIHTYRSTSEGETTDLRDSDAQSRTGDDWYDEGESTDVRSVVSARGGDEDPRSFSKSASTVCFVILVLSYLIRLFYFHSLLII
jgi:hypothetical protein